MKKVFKCMFLLPLVLGVSSCDLFNKKEKEVTETSKYNDGDIVFLNDFETNYDLSKIRILNANFGYKTKFGLNDDTDYVKHGNKSMYAESYNGTTFTFQSFFDDANIDVKERKNFRTVHLDIFNATTKDSNIAIMVNVDDRNTSLLRGEFIAIKDEWTSIDYDLSSLALEYNYERIRGVAVSFTIPTNERMYFDNFSLVAGARLTDEDKANQDKISSISSKINALPEFISESDYTKLNEIYNDYSSLSDLYRRIVPNFSTFMEKSEQYFSGFVKTKPLQADQPFLCNDEFYALNQYVTINGTNAEFNVVPVPDEPVFESIKSEKWLKISLFETANNMITAKGIIDSTSEYETMTTQIYNDSSYVLRIWFNYSNMCYVDVQPHKIVDVEMPTALFNMAQTYWAIHHVIAGTGTIVADRSDVYLTPVVLHRVSDEEIRTKMLSNFEKLPNPDTLIDDDSIIEALYYINNARFYYDKANEQIKSLISQSELNKLIECEEKTSKYGIIYNSADGKYNVWDYGKTFTATSVSDDRFVEVCKCSLTEDPIKENSTLREQSFKGIMTYDPEVIQKYGRLRVYVYNHTVGVIKLNYRDNKYLNWGAESSDPACSVEINPNSWGYIEISTTYLQYNNPDQFTFLISSESSMIGDILISSVFGLPAIE